MTTLVRIIWHDAHPEEGWYTPGDCDDAERLIVSVGFLLRAEKAGHHTIAQDWDAVAGRYCGVSHIPSACVRHMDVIDP